MDYPEFLVDELYNNAKVNKKIMNVEYYKQQNYRVEKLSLIYKN